MSEPRERANKKQADLDIISNLIRETVRDTLNDLIAPVDSVSEEVEEGMDYSPPKTIAFRADNLNQLSMQINDWVRSTGNDIFTISLVPSIQDSEEQYVEALIVFYGYDENFEPPTEWLNGG